MVPQIPHKMKKWTKFEDRWFVAAPGRLEMFPSKEAVETDDYISIIPLSNWQSHAPPYRYLTIPVNWALRLPVCLKCAFALFANWRLL